VVVNLDSVDNGSHSVCCRLCIGLYCSPSIFP
jgi:hypothetical protein